MTSELILNGMTFPIRKSLEDSSRGLRNESSKTTIWIEAICIDQQNLRERSRQVSRMHQIYKNAGCIFVWLGEADKDSDLALDFIAGKIGYDSMDIFVFREDGEASVPQPFEYLEDLLEDQEAEGMQSPIYESSSLPPAKKDEANETLEDAVQGLNSTYSKTSTSKAHLWAAVYRLLQRPYFRRMWVVQEIAAASIPLSGAGREESPGEIFILPAWS